MTNRSPTSNSGYMDSEGMKRGSAIHLRMPTTALTKVACSSSHTFTIALFMMLHHKQSVPNAGSHDPLAYMRAWSDLQSLEGRNLRD